MENIIEKIIKDDEVDVLNTDILRASKIIYRIVDIMGTSKETSKNEFVWDDESELEDDNMTVIKLHNFGTGRYIKRTQITDSSEISVKSKFAIVSEDEITIGDSSNASIMPGFYIVNTPIGFELEESTSSMINISGRDVELTLGTLALHAIQTSGSGSALMQVYSETSADGVTWEYNPINLRQKTFRNDEINFWSMSSGMINWKNGWRVRFRFFTDSNSDIMLKAPTTVVNGTTIKGLSVVWTMEEQ